MSLFQQTLSGPAAVRPRLFSPAHVPSLAVAAVLVVGLLIPFWSWFTAFLAPALGAQQVSLEELSPGGGYSPWLVLPLLAAIGGWSLSYYVHLNPSPTSLGRGEWARTAYVFLLNKLYVDEIYEACVVQPVIRFSRWLWRDVDVRGIDGAIRAVAGSSRHFSRWLGGSVEARGVDGAIRAVAGSSRHFSRWLDGSVEARGVDGSIRGIASSALRLSSWLWTAIEVRTGDRAIRGGGIAAVQLSGWLWRIIDIRGTDQALERRGRLGEGAGEALQRIEPRTLQHHLVVIVFWLVLAIGLSYWLAL